MRKWEVATQLKPGMFDLHDLYNNYDNE